MEATSLEALHQLVDEQAALHRVAALVAREHRAEDAFDAVAREVGQLLDAGSTSLVRYDPGGEATVVSAWTAGSAVPAGGIASVVRETGRPGRLDGEVGSPIVVDGHLWGAVVASAGAEPLPEGTEPRLASFTELVAIAIANEEARDELAASRARIVASADAARRQIERDLHDGIQQRLVALTLDVVRIRSMLEPGEVAGQLEQLTADLDETLQELHEIARGIHPAILTKGGLGPALRDLARRAALPVEVAVEIPERLPEPVEVAAFYVVSEALANAAKHARAGEVRVEAATINGVLRIAVQDDGVGGADPAAGSGLVGLADRVAAAGGTLEVRSHAGEGTVLLVELPA